MAIITVKDLREALASHADEETIHFTVRFSGDSSRPNFEMSFGAIKSPEIVEETVNTQSADSEVEATSPVTTGAVEGFGNDGTPSAS